MGKILRLGIGMALVCLLARCGGQVGGGEGSLDVVIDYHGKTARAGQPLAVAVYESYPPKGAPLTYKLIEDYSFPTTVRFDGLPPGDYVVGASVDLDPSDTPYAGMLKAGVDPFGYAGAADRIRIHPLSKAPRAEIRLERPR
ncbi:MAG: hypothetical protein HYY13_11665 [Nitrospirae bacterium]|nr:hypothetical protein [Nitrospirota bacterium]